MATGGPQGRQAGVLAVSHMAHLVRWRAVFIAEFPSPLYCARGMPRRPASRLRKRPSLTKRLGRYQGKSDSIDATRAARATLSIRLDQLREPTSGQNQMAIRILTNARRSMACERTAAINPLTALRALWTSARRPQTLDCHPKHTITAWRERNDHRPAECDPRQHSRLWTGRVPVPASSGGTTRFRLNRGRDRQLNMAIYTIALIRMNRDQATRDYVARRTRQGRNKKEIIRSLKRYIARQIFRQLNSVDTGSGRVAAVPTRHAGGKIPPWPGRAPRRRPGHRRSARAFRARGPGRQL
jgi:hypothetical protein